jgi:hypothetical protein
MFIMIYLFEACFKVWAMGFKGYVRSPFNQFDLVVVLLGLMEICMNEAGISIRSLGIVRTFRMLKLFRCV